MKKVTQEEFDTRFANGEKDFQNERLVDLDLTNLNLSGLNFENCDLKDTQFDGSIFKRANFKGASLKVASMSDCYFENCNFYDANFKSSELSGANFSYCDLTNANLNNQELPNVIFNNTILTGAKLNNVNMSEVDLTSATTDLKYIQIFGISSEGRVTYCVEDHKIYTNYFQGKLKEFSDYIKEINDVNPDEMSNTSLVEHKMLLEIFKLYK